MEPRRREKREGMREEKKDFFSFVSRDVRQLDDALETLTHAVIGAAIEVHQLLGPGLPEVVYRNSLSHELTLRGVQHVVEARVPILYKGLAVGEGHVDLLVDDRLVLELKVVDQLGGIHKAQVIAYLSALNLQLGLLLNFNVAMMVDGIRRVIRSSP